MFDESKERLNDAQQYIGGLFFLQNVNVMKNFIICVSKFSLLCFKDQFCPKQLVGRDQLSKTLFEKGFIYDRMNISRITKKCLS